jgi:hypothetical protein
VTSVVGSARRRSRASRRSKRTSTPARRALARAISNGAAVHVETPDRGPRRAARALRPLGGALLQLGERRARAGVEARPALEPEPALADRPGARPSASSAASDRDRPGAAHRVDERVAIGGPAADEQQRRGQRLLERRAVVLGAVAAQEERLTREVEVQGGEVLREVHRDDGVGVLEIDVGARSEPLAEAIHDGVLRLLRDVAAVGERAGARARANGERRLRREGAPPRRRASPPSYSASSLGASKRASCTRTRIGVRSSTQARAPSDSSPLKWTPPLSARTPRKRSDRSSSRTAPSVPLAAVAKKACMPASYLGPAPHGEASLQQRKPTS